MSKEAEFTISKISNAISVYAGAVKDEVARVRAEDMDGIHDMRVASRRLRVALREARDFLPEDMYEATRSRIAEVTEALGHARELDVMILMMEEYGEQVYGPWERTTQHVLGELRAVRDEARHGCAQAVSAVDTPEFGKAIEAIGRALKPRARESVPHIGKKLERRIKQLRESYRDWRESEDNDHLHQVRIAFKKLRYAAEFYRPAYDKRMDAIIEEFRGAQELLGDWHDAVVLIDALHRIERHAPYREVQGFPLIIEAFTLFSEERIAAFQSWAKDFFKHSRREELAEYLNRKRH